MKALQLIKIGSLSGIAVNDVPMASMGEDDVLVRIQSMSLNYRDYGFIMGSYSLVGELPFTLGSDASGIVEKVGSRVTLFKNGDRVISLLRQNWYGGPLTVQKAAAQLGGSVAGVFSEYYVFNQNSLVLAPSTLNEEEASTLSTAALTAWRVLTQSGLQPGQTVLIQGTGSVSLFALQMATRMGFHTMVTTGKEENEVLLKNLGANHIVNYKRYSDWEKQVMKISQGVDLVIDVAGGKSLSQSIDALAFNGCVAIIGFLDSAISSINLVTLIRKNARMLAYTTGSKDDLENLVRWLNVFPIKPVISGVYRDFHLAFQEFESRKAAGKIVVTWN